MAASIRPEVVPLDLGSPVMDGFEVARGIRQMPDGGEVKLVALTGYGHRTARETATPDLTIIL